MIFEEVCKKFEFDLEMCYFKTLKIFEFYGCIIHSFYGKHKEINLISNIVKKLGFEEINDIGLTFSKLKKFKEYGIAIDKYGKTFWIFTDPESNIEGEDNLVPNYIKEFVKNGSKNSN